MLVEDKPRSMEADVGNRAVGLGRPGARCRVGVRCRKLGSQSLPVSQSDLDGDCTRLAEAAPKSVAQGGGSRLGHLVAARDRPHSLQMRVVGGRTGPAPAPAAQSTRLPGRREYTEATYGHGRSSAVAFDATPATGDTPPQPEARTPDTNSRCQAAPIATMDEPPGAPPRRLGSRPGRARPSIPPDEGRWWLGPLPR